MPASMGANAVEVSSSSSSSDQHMPVCSRSGFPDPELKVLPCNCHFLSRCFPLSSIINEDKKYVKGKACPSCGETIQGIHLFPMDISALKQQMLRDRPNMVEKESGKVNDKFEEDFYVSIAPIFSVTPTGGVSVAEEAQIRNGRWTKEEIEYVDLLMRLFADGSLPLPDGITLNDFLRSIFLCKSTRLRKKIKSANFCTRTYSSNILSENLHACRQLSLRQEKFLQSLETESDRQLLKFSMSRIWTMHFFNSCVQHDCDIVSARDWLESLELIENQVTASKELKVQRERRLKVDAISKMAAKSATNNEIEAPPFCTSDGLLNSHIGLVPQSLEVSGDNISLSDLSDTFLTQDNTSSLFLTENMNGDGAMENIHSEWTKVKRAKVEVEDLSKIELADDEDLCQQFGDWSPFISKINRFLQKEGLPFEYFDIWLASNNDNSKCTTKDMPEELAAVTTHKDESVVLQHVGHATRSNTDSILTLYHMNEFGKYSSKFNFPLGIGLPGRVLQLGVPLWDDAIDKAALNDFPRRERAKAHGVRKALGIPMFNFPMGKVVVALYCSENVPGDMDLLQHCCAKLQQVSLVPKWEFCVDTGVEERKLRIGPSTKKSGDISKDEPREYALLVDLLGKYAPMVAEDNSGHADMYDNYSSLRLLLLKEPERRSDDEDNVLRLLKQSYKNYLVSGRKENEIASFLVQEWVVLSTNLNSETQNNRQDEVPLRFQPNLHHRKYCGNEMSC